MLLTPEEAVRNKYSNPEYIKNFSGISLWSSEKKLIEKYFPGGSSVLDIGCGTGRVAIALNLLGYTATGIDILPAMLNVAEHQAREANANLSFLKMDAADMSSFSDGSFDHAIMAYNVYELIHGRSRRQKLISEVFRILKPNAHFILTVRSGFALGKRMVWWLLLPLHHPYFKSKFHGRCEWTAGDALLGASFHHYYNPFELKRMVKNHGFELIEFNSSTNIEGNQCATFFTNFSPGRALFYVLRKAL